MKVARRVVVDTNTIVSGILLPNSVPGRLLAHVVERATLIFSPATRDELLTVIAREKFDRYVPIEARERRTTILVRDSLLVTPRRQFHLCAMRKTTCSSTPRMPAARTALFPAAPTSGRSKRSRKFPS